MMARSSLMLKKGDVILVIAVIAIIAGAFLFSNLMRNQDAGKDKSAEIIQNETLVRSFDLSKVTTPEDITVTGKYRNVIRVEQGRIRFLEANCPDQVCVKTGWLQNNGDIAVCLPNRTIIKIIGKAENIDIVSY